MADKVYKVMFRVTGLLPLRYNNRGIEWLKSWVCYFKGIIIGAFIGLKTWVHTFEVNQ